MIKMRFDTLSAWAMLVAATLLSGVTSNAAAQSSFPNRVMTFIWPFGPGTANGEAFRVLADEAGKVLGRPMITEFRPGGGSRLGVTAVTAAPADGHLVAAGLDTIFTALPLMSPTFKAELGKDYAPVVLAVDSTPVWSSHPSLPFRDIKGLIAYAKANPGKLSFGSPGVGSWAHMTYEVFMDAAGGISMLHVPYKGSALAIPDRLSGLVNMYISGPDAAVPQIQQGQLIGLAVIHSQRLAALPDMPTLAEAGVPQANLRNWVGIVTTPGTPQEIVMKLNGAFNAALKTQAVAKAMAAGGWLVNHGTTPEDMTRQIRSDAAVWGPIVRRLNLKAD